MKLGSLISLNSKRKSINVMSKEQIITPELRFGSHFLTQQEKLFPWRQS